MIEKILLQVVTVTDLGEISGSDATTIVNAMNTENTDLNLTETDVDVTPNGDDDRRNCNSKRLTQKTLLVQWTLHLQ
jgi:hypothetical protein